MLQCSFRKDIAVELVVDVHHVQLSTAHYAITPSVSIPSINREADSRLSVSPLSRNISCSEDDEARTTMSPLNHSLLNSNSSCAIFGSQNLSQNNGSLNLLQNNGSSYHNTRILGSQSVSGNNINSSPYHNSDILGSPIATLPLAEEESDELLSLSRVLEYDRVGSPSIADALPRRRPLPKPPSNTLGLYSLVDRAWSVATPYFSTAPDIRAISPTLDTKPAKSVPPRIRDQEEDDEVKTMTWRIGAPRFWFPMLSEE